MSLAFTAIVKNEAHVIERCINSCAPFVDNYCVVDTGSEDGTQEIIRSAFKKLGKEGEVIQSTWKGFGESRTEALAAARERADFCLMMDADHTLAGKMPNLELDAYMVDHRFGPVQYALPIITSTKLKWTYRMPVHEFIESEPEAKIGHAHGLWIDVHHDGHRGQAKDKYQQDAKVLKEYVEQNPDHPRGWYYYAQSLRDSHEPALAFEAYVKRAEMNGFVEENWSARYEAAKLAMELKREDIVARFLDAYNYRPRRCEPLVHLARYHRLRNEHALAYLYAHEAVRTARSLDVLFVEQACYGWLALDEYSLACHFTGRKDEALNAVLRLLHAPDLPANEADRIRCNARAFGLTK